MPGANSEFDASQHVHEASRFVDWLSNSHRYSAIDTAEDEQECSEHRDRDRDHQFHQSRVETPGSMTLAQRFSNRRILVDVLALMFGVGAWIGVNGIYVQLPLLVNKAPESWNLPAYMVLVVQLANLGPIFYTLYSKYISRLYDKFIIYGLVGAAAMAVFCLVFVYDKTTFVFGQDRSSALLGLMFVTAFVGCTSSVLFMPYMRHYREIYLVSYLVGEGLSGFLPSIIALIQGVGGNPRCVNATDPITGNLTLISEYPDPRFSTAVFFGLLASLLFFSFTSFVLLNELPLSRAERVKPPGSTETLPTEGNAQPSYKTDVGWSMPKKTYGYLLVVMGIVCALGNGTLPSIQSYSCLPYGNVAYHLTVTLSSMAGPLAMSLGFFLKNPKVNFITLLTAGILAFSGFIYFLALQSPNPPLQYLWTGELVVVLSWIFVNGLIGFVKMAITTMFRPDPGRGLYYIGVATQIGSLLGAVTTFALVNFSGLFSTYSPCDAYVNAT